LGKEKSGEIKVFLKNFFKNLERERRELFADFTKTRGKSRDVFFELKFAGSLQEKSVSGIFSESSFLKRFKGYYPELKNFCMFCKKNVSSNYQ